MNKTNNTSFQAVADIVAKDFVEAVISDEKFIETMQELASKFVEENVTFVDEEAQFELAFAVFDRVLLKAA